MESSFVRYKRQRSFVLGFHGCSREIGEGDAMDMPHHDGIRTAGAASGAPGKQGVSAQLLAIPVKP
jgi:hypothetical protein